MPRDSARAPQLPLFVSDTAASPEAFARYEAIRPVLKGERSLRQQSQQTGINYWRLWRDLRRFRRDGSPGPDRSAHPAPCAGEACCGSLPASAHPAARRAAGHGPSLYRSRVGADGPGRLSLSRRSPRDSAGARTASPLPRRLAAPSPTGQTGPLAALAVWAPARPALRADRTMHSAWNMPWDLNTC